MKRAISISIGSSRRNKSVNIDLLGHTVCIERIGTDGDMEKASQAFGELDGTVDALSVGGADLGLMVDTTWYPLHSVKPMVRRVKKTPLVDGTGLKVTLERRVGPLITGSLNAILPHRRVLVVAGVDRWGLGQAFLTSGYKCVFGDLMFALGLPIPIRSEKTLKILASVLIPVIGRLPFRWVYPVGKAQEKRTPRWKQYFDWASVIAGDCHYIRRYMPDRLDGKVVVTNTTTLEDVQLFREAGVTHIITTTPVLDGRSFGTNMMEAAIIAATGRTAPVDYANPGNYLMEMDAILDRIHLAPQLQKL